jgi:hypothetical protein
MGFRDPTDEEKNIGAHLKDAKITIYWDGDDVFYSGKIVSIVLEHRTVMVLYDNDDTNTLYEEDLQSVRWKIWDDSVINKDERDEKKVHEIK